MLPENPGKTAFDDELVDRDESELIGPMAKLDALEDASRRREVSGMITTDGDAAVGGLGQVLLHRFL
jgi:hypothetical protein